MSTTNQTHSVSDKSGVHVDLPAHVDAIALTPALVLAVSMLYMMGIDGHIEEEESSQLQASLGGNEKLLQFSLRYVQLVSVDQFLSKAAEVLSVQDKLCILSNVCDSMLSDGRCEPSELALFEKYRTALDVSQAVFEVYFNTIALKNDKKVLGPFEETEVSANKMTPHLALAASLLYMMSADGSIGATEIGQLEAVIGEFEGLQKLALSYVRAVKRAEFLKAASPVLNDQQKLYVLTNVCDSMLSDGSVAKLEDQLFISMLKSYGYSETSFQKYYQVIEVKNIKPFDVSKFKLGVNHTRLMEMEEPDGEVFNNTLTDGKNIQKVDDTKTSAATQSALDGRVEQGGMGAVISRTMQDNIANVNQDFGGEDNIVKVGRNATDQLNVQKLDQSADSANLQKLATDPAAGLNLQRLNGQSEADNRQTIDLVSTRANKQSIDDDLYATYGAPVGREHLSDNVQEIPEAVEKPNLQIIPEEPLASNDSSIASPDLATEQFEDLTPEVRVKNLFEDIDTLNKKLDDFEEKNKLILAIARQAREENRRREAQALAESINRQQAQEAAMQPNLQSLGKEGVLFNVQQIEIDRLESNDPKKPKAFDTSFVKIDVSTSQPNFAFIDAAGNLPGQAHQSLALANPSPEQIWIGAKPADKHGLFGQDDQADDSDTSQQWASEGSGESGHPNQRRIKTRYQGQGSAGAGVPYKVYVKATVTFVVLSCWASSIAAIDTVRTKRFVGVLERAPVVSLMQAPQPTDE